MTALPPFVVTVCDRAHEELQPPASWLHWSIADPVAVREPEAFDTTLMELRRRISTLFPNPPNHEIVGDHHDA